LKNNWGIECPVDKCEASQYIELVNEAQSLDESIMRLASSGKIAQSLKNVEKLLKIQDRIGIS